jgi:hypothetical protein
MTWLELMGRLSRQPSRRRIIQRCYILVDDPLAEAPGIDAVDIELWYIKSFVNPGAQPASVEATHEPA